MELADLGVDLLLVEQTHDRRADDVPLLHGQLAATAHIEAPDLFQQHRTFVSDRLNIQLKPRILHDTMRTRVQLILQLLAEHAVLLLLLLRVLGDCASYLDASDLVDDALDAIEAILKQLFMAALLCPAENCWNLGVAWVLHQLQGQIAEF